MVKLYNFKRIVYTILFKIKVELRNKIFYILGFKKNF